MKNKTVFGIASTHSLKYVLLTGILLCILQFVRIFTLTPTSLYNWTSHPFIKYSFLAGVVFVLSICGVMTKWSLSKNTLYRLGISQKKMFWEFTLNTAVSIMILWAIQILILMAISIYFVQTAPPNLVNAQTIYLTVFRSRFFYLLMPIRDGVAFVNACLLIFMASAMVSRHVLSIKKDLPFIMAILLFPLHFSNGYPSIWQGIFYLLIAIYQVRKGVKRDEA